jgi:hypothetical protein
LDLGGEGVVEGEHGARVLTAGPMRDLLFVLGPAQVGDQRIDQTAPATQPQARVSARMRRSLAVNPAPRARLDMVRVSPGHYPR